MQAETSNRDVQFIVDADTLAHACDPAACGGWLALDTECIRERSYYPEPALVQIASGAGVALIDPTTMTDTAPLNRLLTDPGIVKIIHSAGQDFEILEQIGCHLKSPVFDTQIAAAFLGLGLQTGYKALVEQYLNVVLEKSCTRSNWLQRPLSKVQHRYAIDDVIHLQPLREILQRRLEEENKLAWFIEENERVVNAAGETQVKPENAWQRVAGRGRLGGQPELRRLQVLAAWRERKARVRNLPRQWVIRDNYLVEFAAQCPQTMVDAEKIMPCTKKNAIAMAQKIIALMAEMRNDDAGANLRLQEPPDDGQKQLAGELQQVVAETARRYGMEAPLLASRKQLMQLVLGHNGETRDRLLHGWRGSLLGAKIANVMKRMPGDAV